MLSFHTLRILLAGCLALVLVACATSNQPPETFDGLVLVPDTKFAAVYRRPGADLSHYSQYGLQPCEVAFKKNWLRDQNSGRMDLSNRVTQKDVDKIKDSLSELCEKRLREALAEAPAYPLVAEFDGGEDVLVLRPAIINLDINAPDVQSAGMSRTYTTGAGEMTLLLEVLDGTTGEMLYRIVDRQRAMDTARLQWSNSVTNQAEANRMIKRWANTLRHGLDEVTASATTGS